MPFRVHDMAEVGHGIMSQIAQSLDPVNGSVGSLLMQAHTFWYSLPTLYILIGHCIMCTTLAPEAKKHFLLHYWLTFLGGFAGGPLSALLIMNPAKAPISLMSSNKAGITWTLIWWLMTYSPVAPLLNAIYNIKPVKTVCKTCVSYLRATLIIARVILVAQLYPGVLIAPILTATVSSCSGKATFDAIKHIYGLSTGPAEFTVPTYSFRSAFLGSALFFFSSVNPTTRFMAPEQGAAALITLFVCQSITSELFGMTFDWTAALLSIILRIANIPWPEGIPQPLPALPSKPSNAVKLSSKQPAQQAKPQHHQQAAARSVHQPGQIAHQTSLTAVSVDTTGDLMSYAIMTEDSSYEAGAGENGTMANGQIKGVDGDLVASKVSADVIRAALRKSAKAGKGGKGQEGSGPKADGWQVVGRKKSAQQETRKGK